MAATAPASGVASARDLARFAVGEILVDTYVVRGLLGEGGMGYVYDAHDQLLNRSVAVKSASSRENAAHLRREGEALAAFRHPSIVTVYAMAKHRGVDFLVLERVPGRTLEDHIQQRARTGVPFEIGEALGILVALAEGLALVHASGLSHRDVKPANVMLAPSERVVLIDFGLGVADAAAAAGSTPAGSAAYMAPEVITGSVRWGEASQVDLYGLGVLAFELLTGRLPFRGQTTTHMLSQHLGEGAPDVRTLRPDVPAPLAEAVRGLLAKRPEDRIPTAEALVARLQRVRQRSGQPTEPSLSVLIVDDDPSMWELVSNAVRAAVPAAQIEAVGDAEGALRRFQRRPPELLLLDLDLPGMSGLELCMYLRGTSVPGRCRIVAVSGSASPADEALLRRLGLSRFVTKGPGFVGRLEAVLAQLGYPPTRPAV